MPELLPCPFCGDTDIFIEPDERGSGGQWCSPIHVGCTKCQAEQCADEESDAITAWNRRAAIQQAAGAVPKPRRVTIADARDYLNTNDKAFWVTGWNECVEEMLAASPSPLGREAGSSDHLAACDGGGVTQPLTLPTMDDDLAFILGSMCFQCITYAQMLRAAGQKIETRAEAEQAAVIYWLLGFYFKHGAGWRKAAIEEVERLRAERAPRPDAPTSQIHGSATREDGYGRF